MFIRRGFLRHDTVRADSPKARSYSLRACPRELIKKKEREQGPVHMAIWADCVFPVLRYTKNMGELGRSQEKCICNFRLLNM